MKVIPEYIKHLLSKGTESKKYMQKDIENNIDELEINITSEFKLKIDKLKNNMDDTIKNIIDNTNSEIKQEFTKKMQNLEKLLEDKKSLKMVNNTKELKALIIACESII